MNKYGPQYRSSVLCNVSYEGLRGIYYWGGRDSHRDGRRARTPRLHLRNMRWVQVPRVMVGVAIGTIPQGVGAWSCSLERAQLAGPYNALPHTTGTNKIRGPSSG